MFQDQTTSNTGICRWYDGNVICMGHMFNNATLFNSDISGWNVSSVTDMTSMFQNASAFVGVWKGDDNMGWSIGGG